MSHWSIRFWPFRAPKALLAWGSLTLGLLLWAISGLVLTSSRAQHPIAGIGWNKESVQYLVGILLGMLLFGSPFLTPHEVGANGVVVRLGLLFWGRVPYDNIASVQPTEKKPLGGLGLRLYPDVLFAITWPDRLVSLRLRVPQRFRLFGLVPLWKVSELVFNTEDPSRFVSAVHAHCGAMSGSCR